MLRNFQKKRKKAKETAGRGGGGGWRKGKVRLLTHQLCPSGNHSISQVAPFFTYDTNNIPIFSIVRLSLSIHFSLIFWGLGWLCPPSDDESLVYTKEKDSWPESHKSSGDVRIKHCQLDLLHHHPRSSSLAMLIFEPDDICSRKRRQIHFICWDDCTIICSEKEFNKQRNGHKQIYKGKITST